MNKSLISSIAAATLVGSIGLVYAQSQGTDTYAQPAATQADQSMQAAQTTQPATTDSTTPSTSSTIDSSTPSSTMSNDSSLAAQADRN